MTFYEVVAVKPNKAGADVTGYDSLNDAKNELQRSAETGLYVRIFIRQYFTTHYGEERYRVLHRFTKALL